MQIQSKKTLRKDRQKTAAERIAELEAEFSRQKAQLRTLESKSAEK